MDTPPRFFADVMLGRLARWLRILGYDTAYERGIEDDELIRRADREDRTILTRDTGLLQRPTRLPTVFLESEKPRLQLAQLRSQYGVELREESLFTRCSWCNGPLTERSRDEVRGRVPPYVLTTNERIMHCPACDKLYWRGTHGSRFIKHAFGSGADE